MKPSAARRKLLGPLKEAQDLASIEKEVRLGFSKTVDLIAAEFTVLRKVAQQAREGKESRWKNSDTQLLAKLGHLLNESSVIQRRGTKPEVMREWLKQYNIVEMQMKSELPWLKDANISSDDRARQRAAEKDREDFIDDLGEKLGSVIDDKDAKREEKRQHFEEMMIQHADKLGKASSMGVKLWMTSLLGPGAPVLHVLDEILDIDKHMSKGFVLTRKGLHWMSKGLKKGFGHVTSSIQAGIHQQKVEAINAADRENEVQIQQRAQAEENRREAERRAKIKYNLWDRMVDLMFGIKHAITKKGEGGSGMKGLLELLGIGGLLEGAKELIGKLGFGKHGLLRRVSGILLDVGKDLGKKGLGLLKDMGKFLFVDGWKVIKDLGGRFLTGAWSLIKNVGGKLVDVLMDGFKAIGGFVADGVGALLASPEILIGAAVVAAVVALGYFAWKYRKQIAAFAIKTWDKIKTGVEHAWESVKSHVEHAWDAAKTDVKQMKNRLVNFAEGTWASLKGGVASAWSSVTGATIAAWDSGKDELSSFAHSISDKYDQVKNWMLSKVKSLGDTIWSKVTGAWTDVKHFAGGAISGATNLAASALSTVGNMKGRLDRALIGGAGSAISGVGSAFGSSSLSRAGSAVSGYGRSMGAADEALGSLASGAVQKFGGRAASALGYKMPNKTIADLILNAARTVGIDPGIAMATAQAESNFDPNARAGTSSAGGLFQFTNATWAAMVQKYGKQFGIGLNDKMSAKANAIMGALFIRDNQRYLMQHGVAPNAGNTYMAHFLGAGTAVDFIKDMYRNPNANAAALFPAQARANKSIFYQGGMPQSLANVYDLMTGNPNKVTVAKANAYDQRYGAVASAYDSRPAAAYGAPATMTRGAPMPMPMPSAAPVVASAGPSASSSYVGPTLSVDTVPAALTDEGLLILNTPGVRQ